jgi:flagellar protein FliO/FliZ
MKKMLPASFLLVALLFAGDIFAQTGVTDSASVSPQNIYSPSLFGIVIKLIISMVVIVGLIYLSMYFLKKINSRAAGGGIIGDTIKIIGRTFLSPKQSLYLVKIGDRYAIIGATEQSVSMIGELSEKEAAKFESQGKAPGDSSPRSKFTELFKGIIRQ